MRKSFTTIIVGFLLMISASLTAQVSTWDGSWEPWTNGTGTENDPFLIENAQQLAYLAYRVNNGLDAGGGHVSNHDYYYKMMIDVDLNGSENFQWTPIGYWNSDADYQCFGGHFDGNNHSVAGLYINSNANRVGFFGYADGVTIENLSIHGEISSTTTDSFAGAVIGENCNGTSVVMNCINYATVFGVGNSGGIIGISGISELHLSECQNYGNISSNRAAGGIIGRKYNGNANVFNCSNYGDILVTSSVSHCYVGGIVGLNHIGSSYIRNCYNMGNVSMLGHGSYRYASGILGANNTNIANVENTYNAGDIFFSGNVYTGGIASTESGTTNVLNSYYINTCGGNNGYGEPMTDVYMKSSEFVDVLNNGSCSWEQDSEPYQNQGYPLLTGIIVSATTSDATDVTQSHATLHGTIGIANASIQSQGFEYKKTSDDSWQTVSVSGSGDISTTLANLTPNTQYSYRAFCTPEDCVITYGSELTFTTQNVTVTTYSATDVTASSATLNGYIDTGDMTIIEKGFKYWLASDPYSVTDVIVTNTGSISANVHDFEVNQTYQYKTFVSSNDNVVYSGEIRTFETSWLNADTIYVHNVDMLHWVSEQCNSGVTFEGKYVKLMSNIELPLNVPNNMTSIGTYPNRPFKGTFDGNGMLITNLYIDQPNTAYQGFFGYTLNANLYNVGLVNIAASGRNYTGGMVAFAQNTHMRDCYVNGGTLYALSYCGGLVGYQEQGTNSIISGCYNTCTVSGNHYVGGLVGFSNYGTVRNSYVAAPITGQGDAIGAIIGGANEVLMYNCYFSTEITGLDVAIGENNFKSGEGLTNAQMRDPQFVATMNQGLVTPVWKADYEDPLNNGFPILIWQLNNYGVEEMYDISDNLVFYPNPANEFVVIQFDNEDNAFKQIKVFDAMGREVIVENASGQQHNLDVSKLSKGIYFVRVITNDNNVANAKIVVQ